MPKQVPEEEVRLLRKTLEKHNVFRELRGKLGGECLARLINDLAETTASPTEWLARWDKLSSKVRVVGSLLARWKRDGHEAARGQLVQALMAIDHRLPYEDTAPVAKVPLTLLMLDPVRTMAMIRWIVCDNWKNLDDYLINNYPPTELTRELFAQFPTLEEHALKRRKNCNYEGWELCRAYHDTVVGHFTSDPARSLLSQRIDLCLECGQYHDRLEIDYLVLAYVVPAEQRDVISFFSRDEQDQIATWQLRVPETVNLKFSREFGFHPEPEHTSWQHEYPDYCSVSVSHSLGAICFYKEFTSGPWSCHALGDALHSGWRNKDILRFRLRGR